MTTKVVAKTYDIKATLIFIDLRLKIITQSQISFKEYNVF